MTPSAERIVVDDLGAEVPLPGRVERVVCLVPSLTETIAGVDAGLLVGATDWCTYPPDLDVTRVRGTKNPDLRRIAELKPDLVVANMEENRELDVRRMRAAGLPVWVTRIETVAEALASISRLLAGGLDRPVPEWLPQAQAIWSEPAPSLGLRVAVPVWRDPWFMVGPRTYADDVLTRCGFTNVFGTGDQRYPKVPVEWLTASDVDLVLLPDEPYEFTAADGPDAVDLPTALVPGRALTWHGPTLLTARDDLVRPALAAAGRGGADERH